MEEVTVKSVITPNDKFVRSVFETNKAYLIDIYQREYKWTKHNVETLLNDIEVRFNQHKRKQTEPEKIQIDVQRNFEPYYLNTFLTHSTAENVSIVDGQQRLTTLLLIIIKLYNVLKIIEKNPDNEGKTFVTQTLEKLILERSDFGKAKRFKIFNPNRESVLRSILDNTEFSDPDETQQKILDNYVVIDRYYEKFLLKDAEDNKYDLIKLTYYISYLLDRISIVEIKIEKQKNVAMIFEVVNDRGLGLKPYEILKGKLIGELPGNKKEYANDIWVKLQNKYYSAKIKNSTDSRIDLDMFFQTFFRAKFADSENDYEKFEGDYHYEIYKNPKIKNYFKNFEDQDHLYKVITEDINFFANVYYNIRTSYEYDHLIYNKLLDQNQQYLLIMSSIDLNDPRKKEKIHKIAQKFDQLHTLIRLFDVYESQKFQRIIYPLNKNIRNKGIDIAFAEFDSALIQLLEDEQAIQKGQIQDISNLFNYDRFKYVGNRWINFSKYVLMRIDRYLSFLLDKPSYAGGSLEELEEHFNKTTRRKYGMHLEHIYAYNSSNKALFTDSNGIFDEQLFHAVRNRLGMVLLLKDRQNESSNNEPYSQKFSTYSGSNFIWNEMMVGALHKVDSRNLPDWDIEVISTDPTGAFPFDKVDSRQKSLYKAIKQIWLDEVTLS